MKILFLSLRCPYPPQRGDRIRNYHFIKQLAQRHALTVVSFVESDQEIDHIKQMAAFCDRVEWVRFHRIRSGFNALLHSLSRQPLQLHYWYASRMQQTINKLLDEVGFDLIHVHLFRMAQYVSCLSGIPKMLDLCDSMALNLHRRAALDRSLKWPLIKLEAHRVRQYEIETVNAFDWGTVAAAFDRDYLIQQDENLRLSVIPTGVDLEYFQPTSAEYQPHLLFTGTMSYFPNWDAVLYFYREIFPLIQSTYPETVFYIVGNQPAAPIKRLANRSKVVVTGYVSDVRPYFDQAAVFVSPMRSGSGIQVKNLEAMAMGVPVVTTSIGALGLEAKSGRDLLIADTPKEFANHVINLIGSRERRQEIGEAGRQFVEGRYNWPLLAQRLEAIYSQICNETE
ncbi:MAG: TIGR03087 family PEP-CTERM/XrtA system glycosyltransferase [Candidatus Poribacteria bacterium]|nr:TIGR03087 family PEP-CTERM/XrtA system glycosyltransferase [Candidatus Poribacteria bacterium]